ncbi:unnamed protein product [Arctia plantaginis]|uniref:Uncharacterized protein n=1 Tax=Arctia plantaginis TaxID=874455 RepID=A0A8S1B0C3_ARCPL|nr:unnamed protein product [Arctia plantaginis]
MSDVNQLICDGVVLFGKYYEKQLLFGALHEPRNLLLHSLSGELFFSHTIHKGADAYSTIRTCNMNTKRCIDIKTVEDGRAIAYDRNTSEIYFGGSKGIYKYDFKSKTARLHAENGTSIWNMFIQDLFYYVDASTKRIVANLRGYFHIIPLFSEIEFDNIFFSVLDHMYFSNRTGLYKAQSVISPIFVLNNTMDVRQISQDINDNRLTVYFAAKDGLYIQDPSFRKMIMVAAIDNVFGVTFRNISDGTKNKSEILYSDQEAIYKLVKSRHGYSCMMKFEAQKQAARSINLKMTVDLD